MNGAWLDPILDHPKRVFVGLLVAVVAVGSMIVRVQVDTDPENMLSADEPVRVFHSEVKKRFALHDSIVVGIERPGHPHGVFTPDSLRRIYAFSKRIEQIDHVVADEILGPAHVDDIRPTGPGTVSFRWLLEDKLRTPAEAQAVRDAALRLPMLKGTVVSEDGKSIALYVPVAEKKFSHRVSEDIRAIIADLAGPEVYHFAGLPVAEDTFGVEMFIQMAVCAPLAGLAIFLLMWMFFRSASLVVSPMIVAMATVIMTMGALIGAGFTVHIMSSMIAIFLMPIAVVDSVHILSEFADRYPQQRDAKATIRAVVGQLYTPMLYTSLTSAAGFLSLVITPIPPVRVFGVFVALGILLAFFLTITVIPAYVATMSPRSLASLQAAALVSAQHGRTGLLARIVAGLRSVGIGRSKAVLVGSLVLVFVGVRGIMGIEINDNPVRWFRASHDIRVADRTLNDALAGTYPAYLVIEPTGSVQDPVAVARAAIAATSSVDRKAEFESLVKANADDLVSAIDDRLFEDPDGEAAWSAALAALNDVERQSQKLLAPEWLQWIENVQAVAAGLPNVGKTTSVADVVKTVHRELREGDPDAYSIPKSQAGVSQTLLVFQSSHRPRDLFHLVTPDYRSAAIWFQLESGDNRDMTEVRARIDDWIAEHPAPGPASAQWAGLTYINVVWQEKMVKGMLDSLLGAFVVVFIMMVLLFRSLLLGFLSMLPLAFTIVLVYGITGLIGKDYDMPVAVLSSLSLGLSVDFAIHFLERSRQHARRQGDLNKALLLMFEEPARAIMRNAIVIAVGFLPLLAAPLVPYNTVGILMASIMAVSSIVTLVLLPSLIKIGGPRTLAP